MVTREAVIGMVIGQVAVTAAEAQVGMGKKDVQKIVTGTVAAMVLVVTGMAVAVVEAPHAMKGGPKIALVLMIVRVVAAGRPMIEGGMIMHLESACLSSCWFLWWWPNCVLCARCHRNWSHFDRKDNINRSHKNPNRRKMDLLLKRWEQTGRTFYCKSEATEPISQGRYYPNQRRNARSNNFAKDVGKGNLSNFPSKPDLSEKLYVRVSSATCLLVSSASFFCSFQLSLDLSGSKALLKASLHSPSSLNEKWKLAAFLIKEDYYKMCKNLKSKIVKMCPLWQISLWM